MIIDNFTFFSKKSDFFCVCGKYRNFEDTDTADEQPSLREAEGKKYRNFEDTDTLRVPPRSYVRTVVQTAIIPRKKTLYASIIDFFS